MEDKRDARAQRLKNLRFKGRGRGRGRGPGSAGRRPGRGTENDEDLDADDQADHVPRRQIGSNWERYEEEEQEPEPGVVPRKSQGVDYSALLEEQSTEFFGTGGPMRLRPFSDLGEEDVLTAPPPDEVVPLSIDLEGLRQNLAALPLSVLLGLDEESLPPNLRSRESKVSSPTQTREAGNMAGSTPPASVPPPSNSASKANPMLPSWTTPTGFTPTSPLPSGPTATSSRSAVGVTTPVASWGPNPAPTQRPPGLESRVLPAALESGTLPSVQSTPMKGVEAQRSKDQERDEVLDVLLDSRALAGRADLLPQTCPSGVEEDSGEQIVWKGTSNAAGAHILSSSDAKSAPMQPSERSGFADAYSEGHQVKPGVSSEDDLLDMLLNGPSQVTVPAVAPIRGEVLGSGTGVAPWSSGASCVGSRQALGPAERTRQPVPLSAPLSDGKSTVPKAEDLDFDTWMDSL